VTFAKLKAFSVTAARTIRFVNSDQNSKFPKNSVYIVSEITRFYLRLSRSSNMLPYYRKVRRTAT